MDSARCQCGTLVESVEHLITECPLYDDLHDLGSMNVGTNDEGEVILSNVLSTRNSYDSLCSFSVSPFVRRKTMRE